MEPEQVGNGSSDLGACTHGDGCAALFLGLLFDSSMHTKTVLQSLPHMVRRIQSGDELLSACGRSVLVQDTRDGIFRSDTHARRHSPDPAREPGCRVT